MPELCVEQKGPYMTFAPSEGTRETLFTIEANVPDVDGEPVGYSWNFYGTDFDEREQRFFMPWTPTSAKARIVHRFADEGANVENDVYRVPVTLRVEFKNGETKMYQGLLVVRGHRPAVLYRPWRWPWWKKLWMALKERIVSSEAPPQL